MSNLSLRERPSQAQPSTSGANLPSIENKDQGISLTSPTIQAAPPNPPQTQQLNYGKRRIVVDLSSLPLQVLLHLNVYFFILYWLIELLLYIYKGTRLPYPDVYGTLTLEIVLLFLVAFIEAFRLFFGYKGNLGERKQTLIWSVILALPILVSQLYLILWQTYVLRVEVIICAIFFVMVSLEILLSAATIWTFQRHEAFVHG